MRKVSPRQSAFSLVEVTMALGIIAFCLTAVFALLPIGLTTTENALDQTRAANIALAIGANLRMLSPGALKAPSPAYLQTSPLLPVVYGITVPLYSSAAVTDTLYFTQDGTVIGTNPNSNLALNAATPGYFRATITFQPPLVTKGATPQKTATFVNILMTWPAMADSKALVAPSKYTGSFQTVTELNCN